MKKLIKTINAYYFNELPKEIQEKVIEDYKNDEINQELENDLFYEYITEVLKEKFPKSDLKVEYSLNYCQGDGLNIYGELELKDFIDNIWNVDDKTKRTMLFYAEYMPIYEFSKNYNYGYSCKFQDRNDIPASIDELVAELEFNEIKNIKENILKKFYNDMIDYFEKLDMEYEKIGYSTVYFDYEGADKNIASIIVDNEWMYDINGNFIADFEYEEEK